MSTSPSGTPRRIITHSEEFHTDDVFATALLLALFPNAEVVRSRDEAILASGDIVYDVGKVYDPARGRYDHHQAQAGKRPNGITYSSFGLLWKEYGVQYCGGDAEVAAAIDKKLVTPIDAVDNGQAVAAPVFDGIRPFTIDDIIKMLNPLRWTKPDETHDTQFKHAVALAGDLLARLRASVADSLASQKALLAAYAAAPDKRIVVMDAPASAGDVLTQCPELLYLISPRPEGSWGVLAVPTEPGSFMPRRPFPDKWRALPAAELAEAAAVADAIFCHATGFYAAARSREGALALAGRSIG